MLFGLDQPRRSKTSRSTEEFGSSGRVGLELAAQCGCFGLGARVHDASRLHAVVGGFDADGNTVRVEKGL